MHSFQVSTDAGAAAPLATPLQLSQALRAAAIVTVQAGAGGAVRASSDPDGGWRIELTETSDALAAVSRRRATVPNTDAAYDLIRSWCNGDGWWAEAFHWEPFAG